MIDPDDAPDVPGYRDGRLRADVPADPVVLSTYKTPRHVSRYEAKREWKFDELPQGTILGAVAEGKSTWVRARIIESWDSVAKKTRAELVLEKIWWPKDGPQVPYEREKWLRGIPLSNHRYTAIKFPAVCMQAIATMFVEAVYQNPAWGYAPGSAQGLLQRRPNMKMRMQRELERLQNAAVTMQKMMEAEDGRDSAGDPEPGGAEGDPGPGSDRSGDAGA